MGGRGTSLNTGTSILRKINALGTGNEVDNPLKMSPSNVLRNGGRQLLRELRSSGKPIEYKVETLNISDLQTEQATIFKDNLIPIAKNVRGVIDGSIPIKGAKNKDTGIRAVRYDGHVTVVDGNHRVVVAKLLGQKKIKLKVFTAN